MRSLILYILAMVTLSGCSSLNAPEGISPINHFDLQRYLGTWYEVARLDHRFEKGLEQVSATYSMREDGGVKVINRGYQTKTGVWKASEGKAYFTGTPNIASLKVSFFGPFYGGYHVIALDKDYQYALVVGPNREYLWILSRQKTLPQSIRENYLQQAKQLGYPVDSLIWVAQKP